MLSVAESFLKQIDYSNRDLNEQFLKTNTFKLQSFLNKNKSLTYGKFQDLFFYRNEDWKYETMTLKENIAQREKAWINFRARNQCETHHLTPCKYFLKQEQ